MPFVNEAVHREILERITCSTDFTRSCCSFQERHNDHGFLIEFPAEIVDPARI